MSFVDFHRAGDPVTFRPPHRSPQLVQQDEGRLVSVQAELALQLQSREAARVGGRPPRTTRTAAAACGAGSCRPSPTSGADRSGTRTTPASATSKPRRNCRAGSESPAANAIRRDRAISPPHQQTACETPRAFAENPAAACPYPCPPNTTCRPFGDNRVGITNAYDRQERYCRYRNGAPILMRIAQRNPGNVAHSDSLAMLM